MQRKFWQISLISLIIFLLGGGMLVLAANRSVEATPNAPQLGITNSGPAVERVQAATANTYTTIITVTTSVDSPGDGQSVTCNYTGGTYSAAGDGICNFRRALVEASYRPPADRPILIRFNLPLTDTNYDSDTETWTLVMESAYTAGGLDFNNVTEPKGLVTIDGNTQPNGRSDGSPKIVINSDDASFTVLSEDNIIRNLIFNGGSGVFLNEVSGIGGGNLVENVWVGLNAAGTEIVPGSNPNISLAGSGIFIQSDNNVISGTRVTGTNTGIQVQGDNNLIHYNWIGLRADGTAPIERLNCDNPSNLFNPAEWYGGWGIQFLNGSNNQVLSNTIAALQSAHSPTETTPPAVSTAGSDNTFAYNRIGYDANGTQIGTCGGAFILAGQNTQILSNTIYGSNASFDPDGACAKGVLCYTDSSPLARKITMRNNIIEDGTVQAIEFGEFVPSELRLFEPPRIIRIEGTTVEGRTKAGSDCPNCLLEIFLDDLDGKQEALELMTTAVVDSSGNFTATLPRPITTQEGLRLTATTQDDGVIGNFWAGTTSLMSPAYSIDGTFSRDLAPGWNLVSFDVTPASTAVADVLNSIDGQYDVVLGYDSSDTNDPAKTYDPANVAASDLTELSPLAGYWINITASTTQTLSINGDPIPDDTPIQLVSGWNLVSYLPDLTMPLTMALDSLQSTPGIADYDIVQTFDGQGLTYFTDEPDFNTLSEMKPGYGYWIKVDDTVVSTTLRYRAYDAARPGPQSNTPAAAAKGGAAALDFFTPTTEWADFFGVVLLSGGRVAPENTTLLAYDADGVAAGGFTIREPGFYGFMPVYADDSRTAADEGVATTNETLIFALDNRRAYNLTNQGQANTQPIPWPGRGMIDEQRLIVQMPFIATNEWVDYYGTVTIGGSAAPTQTLLAAYDPDGVYIGDYRLSQAGQFGFMSAYGDDPLTTGTDEGAVSGDKITFKAFPPGQTNYLPGLIPDEEVPVVLEAQEDTTWNGRGSRVQVTLSPATNISFQADPASDTSERFIGASGFQSAVAIPAGQIAAAGTFTFTDGSPSGRVEATAATERSFGLASTTTINGQINVTLEYPDTVSQPNELGLFLIDPNSGVATETTSICEGSPSYTVNQADNAIAAPVCALGTYELRSPSTGATSVAPTGIDISGPSAGTVDTAYSFNITVNPVDVTTPLTYTINRTDGSPTVQTSGRTLSYGPVTWATTGTKLITVTAANTVGTISEVYSILIEGQGTVALPNNSYLPLVIK